MGVSLDELKCSIIQVSRSTSKVLNFDFKLEVYGRHWSKALMNYFKYIDLFICFQCDGNTNSCPQYLSNKRSIVESVTFWILCDFILLYKLFNP